MKQWLTMLVFVVASHAANWYASPTASANGNGSLANPWPLPIALASASVLPGDILYLRGGSYSGPGMVSTLSGTSTNYITVTAYPAEWPVITSGASWVLGTNLLTNTTVTTTLNVPFTNSDTWPEGTSFWVTMGGEFLYCSSRHTGTILWTVDRNSTNGPAHSSGTTALLQGPFISHSGSYTTFSGFEITSTYTNRSVSGASTSSKRGGIDMSGGSGNKAIDLIIHNVGHPGIGFWNQGQGGEVNGCMVWGNGVFDNDGTWIRGAGLYGNNSTGTVLMKNNIIMDNISEGFQAYGSGAPINGFRFINNITINNGNSVGLAVWAADLTNAIGNDLMWTNYFGLDTMTWGYTSLSNTAMSAVGNVVVAPPCTFIKEWLSGTWTNNTFFIDGNNSSIALNGGVQFTCTETNQSSISFDWDHNTYYGTNTDGHLFLFRSSDVYAQASNGSYYTMLTGDGTNNFYNWTGWDSNSTYSAWPNNYLTVSAQPLDYDANKWHICVVSSSGQTNATLTLSSLGFTSGQTYAIIDAQNWPVVVNSGTYTSGTVNLPLNLTNLASMPGITNFVPSHSNMKYSGLFNAFVLEKSDPAPFIRVLP